MPSEPRSQAEPAEITAVDLASRYIGQQELAGRAANPHVVAWLYDCGFTWDVDEAMPWCGAFVKHVAHLLSLPIPATPARARSWLTVGRPVALVDALAGWDVVILSRGGGPQPPASVLEAPGHVGWFYGHALRMDGARVLVLGGNQGDMVSVQAYALDRVLGVRRLR